MQPVSKDEAKDLQPILGLMVRTPCFARMSYAGLLDR